MIKLVSGGIFLFLFFFLSCGTRKQMVLVSPSMHAVPTSPIVGGASPKEEMSAESAVPDEQRVSQMVQAYQGWKSKLTSLHLKMKGTVTIPGNMLITNASILNDIHLLRDSMIWLSAYSPLLGQEVFRGIFEKDKVTLMSSFITPNKQEIAYQDLPAVLGITLVFDELQAMFFLPILDSFSIAEHTATDPLNVEVTLPPSSWMTRHFSFQIPSQAPTTFPTNYALSYTVGDASNQRMLRLHGEMGTDEQQQLNQWNLSVEALKQDRRKFLLNQKSIAVEVNYPFQRPSFD